MCRDCGLWLFDMDMLVYAERWEGVKCQSSGLSICFRAAWLWCALGPDTPDGWRSLI